MKYFTRYWLECADDSSDLVASAYRAHFNSIKSRLPPPLVELEELYELHDAEVRMLAYDVSSKTLEMHAFGWNREFDGRVDYAMRFSGVEDIKVDGLVGDSFSACDLGEIGYWECHSESACTIVCVLCSCGIEISVRFSEFSFHAVPA